MTVKLGTIQTFADVKPDKAQALKVLEEASEVFNEWQLGDEDAGYLLDACADVIQATCNLLAARGVEDFTEYMEACRRRNVKWGRM